ncbi:hypothetical protein F1721_26435 [Saccharopolyspora hirsuta]|uniref:Uncharacterized protein n=1 Tax=Saccharopolyspora hirsuta TaxID=1837 RepID=A0A5M7BHD3_SACHI|nr:hypothetical protein [Saccharopolyspora hirsuta]KAA5829206.1 hypothetical protein F1721_26435 [Saccharopolyspora hirsuta]
MARTLFDGEVPVHYGQVYVESGGEYLDLQKSLAGQRNGLLGAAEPGGLFLITGLHTGDVGFTVELHEQAPPLDDTWEEIVEASYQPAGDASLVSWGGEASWPLDLTETDYRARYSALRMDEANELDTRLNDEPLVDRYLLQLWPAPPAPDRILKQTSDIAAYWHGVAGG